MVYLYKHKDIISCKILEHLELFTSYRRWIFQIKAQGELIVAR